MIASLLRSPLLIGCLLLSLAGQGVCEERRSLQYSAGNLATGYSLSFEIVKLAASKLDWKIEYFPCTWKRCLLMMESGNLDMMGTLFKTRERAKYMHYIEPPYFSESIVFYFQKGLGSGVREYKDLKGLTIGIIIGIKYFEPFDSDLSLDKFSVTYNEQRHKMLDAGRIDTLITAEIGREADLIGSKYKGLFEKAPYHVKAGDNYFAISKKSPFTKNKLEFGNVLKQLIDSGKVKEIYTKLGLEWRPPTQQAPK